MQSEKIQKVLFILPTCLFLLVISIFPFLYSVYLSLFQAKLTKMHKKFFIGWENYQVLLFEDDTFPTAIKNTFMIAFSSITIEIILGFIMAKIFFEIRHIKFSNALRTVTIMPIMLTPLCVGLVFLYILNPTLGIFSYILDTVFGIEPFAYLGEPIPAKISIIVINSWQWTPFMMILLLAGLMTVPNEQYEAAKIDGANWFHVMTKIEIPSILSFVLLGVVLRLIECIRLFDIIYITTKGGPGIATEVMAFFTYRTEFRSFQIGTGSASAVIILIISLIVTTIAVTLLRRVERNEGLN